MIMFQVNKFLFSTKLARSYFKYTDSYFDTSKVLFPLESRTLINVSGPDAPEFLQGLITNDMNNFKDGALTMYAMFLNNKGRVLYDTLVHKCREENTFMLECDFCVHDLLQKHLHAYKLKRAVRIGDISRCFKVWALITPSHIQLDYKIDFQGNINIYKDPRLQDLGYRLITSTEVDHFDLLDALGKDTVIEDNERGYQTLKYKLGVSEGAEDMFPGACLPLEANCDYLNGVSFQKGCYIGKESTSLGYHSGVIRRRIMPVTFPETETITQNLQYDALLWTNIETGRKNIGRLKSYVDGHGLALVIVQEAIAAKDMKIGLSPVKIIKPAWWPTEAPKEKFTPTKPEQDTILTEEPTKIVYHLNCTQCRTNEKALFAGINLPFSRNVLIKCPSYVMKNLADPKIGKGEIVVLEPQCEFCGSSICMNTEYIKQCILNKNYCLDGAHTMRHRDRRGRPTGYKQRCQESVSCPSIETMYLHYVDKLM